MQPAHGYHKSRIPKGVLGELSKIEEEFEELVDAKTQGNKILMMCELADLYGAIEAFAIKQGLTMRDIKTMSDATTRAFLTGER